MISNVVFFLVLLGVCGLTANIQRHRNDDDRCEFCDDDAVNQPHLGMCLDCYEFYHVDG